MAKRQQEAERSEHLSYCAGWPMVGNGTQATSSCPFDHSLRITSERYACGDCVAHIRPDQIHADANGITEAGLRALARGFQANVRREETTKKRLGRPPKKRVDDLPSLTSELDEIVREQLETEPEEVVVAATPTEPDVQEIPGDVVQTVRKAKKKKVRGRKRLPRGV